MDAHGYKNIDISSVAQNLSFKELFPSPIYSIRELACIDKRHVFHISECIKVGQN